MRTTSGSDGAFRFIAVGPGSYRVRAERDGFTPSIRDVQVPRNQTSIRLPIVMAKPGDADVASKLESRVVGGIAPARAAYPRRFRWRRNEALGPRRPPTKAKAGGGACEAA